MSEQETRQVREDVLAGLNLSFQKLVEEKSKKGDELAFSQKGEVYKIKASDLV